MLTPQEVSEHAFAKASFGGYHMAMVDEFLDVLTTDYSALYSENAILKSKMKVLVDKVEEYRATEDAMRKALLTAQRMADDMVQEAEIKKASLLKEAEAAVAERKSGLVRQIADEEYRRETACKKTAEYVAKVRAICLEQLDYLDALPDEVVPVITNTADQIESTAMEIEDTVQKLIAAAMPPSTERAAPEKDQGQSEPSSEPQPEDELVEDEPEDYTDIEVFVAQAKCVPAKPKQSDDEPTCRINLDSLQFGKQFEIK